MKTERKWIRAWAKAATWDHFKAVRVYAKERLKKARERYEKSKEEGGVGAAEEIKKYKQSGEKVLMSLGEVSREELEAHGFVVVGEKSTEGGASGENAEGNSIVRETEHIQPIVGNTLARRDLTHTPHLLTETEITEAFDLWINEFCKGHTTIHGRLKVHMCRAFRAGVLHVANKIATLK